MAVGTKTLGNACGPPFRALLPITPFLSALGSQVIESPFSSHGVNGKLKWEHGEPSSVKGSGSLQTRTWFGTKGKEDKARYPSQAPGPVAQFPPSPPTQDQPET